ncbi:MAG: hypothetical protein KAI25_04180, partial [Hyphomicrobiaceae bacterium]|nr:hypothetical protein [Hyphomicrobiaceae bacterium]
TRSSARNGISKRTMRRYLDSIGWVWTPTMFIGSGCKVHLREDELPTGRLIVSLSRHLAAVIEGVVHDTHDPTRDGTRCVYGYWQEEGTFRRLLRESGVSRSPLPKWGVPWPVEPEPFAEDLFPLPGKRR